MTCCSRNGAKVFVHLMKTIELRAPKKSLEIVVPDCQQADEHRQVLFEPFNSLRWELKDAHHRAHYLAIPPVLFETVVEQLAKSNCASGARVIVEKPFGHDLATAQELNKVLLGVFDEADIFRIDHYLRKRPVNNLLAFRFANSFVEAFWNRTYIESVQITMAEISAYRAGAVFTIKQAPSVM
jgi:glucose-6-phosphate 1-dehydrogenase